MELVVAFICDVRIPYSRDMMKPIPLLQKHRNEALLREWILTALALSQTRKQSSDEKLWLFRLALKFMATDRVSDIPCPRSQKLMLCKDAAQKYKTLHEEIDRMTYGRRQ
jgi:hypothetical protein